MFFVLSKLLDVFLSPFTWAIVFGALAFPWRRPRRPQRWRRRRAFGLAGILILAVFGTEPVSNGMLYRLERAVPSTYRTNETYDVIVLLGGVSDERVVAEMGQPAFNDNVERLIVTHRLLADGKARFAIISGGPMEAAFVDTGEARVLARQIEAWGVSPSRLILEEGSRNTRENAVYSERIVRARGFAKVLLVTSAFHMRRAVECFEAVGMKVDTLAVDYRASNEPFRPSALLPRAGNFASSSMTLREFLGLYIYRLQGYAKPR